jgi:hypothetical protein
MVGPTFVETGPGNGAPCLPNNANNVGGTGDTDGSHACAGTSNYGAIAYHDNPITQDSSNYGDGSNFSIMLGGQSNSTIDVTSPSGTIYEDLALYQEVTNSSGTLTPANFGLDAEPGDDANITINGLVYNASLPDYGESSSVIQDFWDTGIPFYQGGTLQTGYGTGGSTGWNPSNGKVVVNGITVVDDFNTDGNTPIYIMGGSYQFPNGLGGLSLTG